MVEDTELLRRYTEEDSQEAFTELVNRHLALVYFGALRRASNAQLAADVSQAVFIALAQNARSLRAHPALGAWLFTATRNAAINVRVAEERRRKREQEALTMHESSSDERPNVEWDRLKPLLYEALDTLSDKDRRAVLLRFFAGRTFADIGKALRLTEEAARKRVDRAVAAMHATLSRRGITSTTAAITGALSAEAIAQPPATLATTISSVAAASVANGSAAFSAVAYITMSKIKVGIIGGIVAAGMIIVGLQFQTARALTGELKITRNTAHQFIALQKENQTLNRQLATTTSVADREELDRLRKQITALKVQPAGVDEAKMRPVSEMKHAGWATPESSFETLFWAQVQSPNTMIDIYTRSFRFDAETKIKAELFFAGLSPEARVRFQTPEQLFAPYLFGWGVSKDAIIKAQKDPIVAVQILEKTNHDHDPDWVDLRFWQRSASSAGFEGRVRLTRVGDEWLQARRGPMSAENWKKIISQIDPMTGEPRVQGR